MLLLSSASARACVDAIHLLDCLLQGAYVILPIISAYMAPLVMGDTWHGSPNLPHTTENIKTMKTCLTEGYRAALRRNDTAIWLKQGPDSHRRAAPFGVVLSGASVDNERNELAKRIDREKFIYLVKSGEGHATYASFNQYQLRIPEVSKCGTPAAPPSASRFIIASATLSTQVFRALPYGDGSLAIQSVWWLSRHVSVLCHPLMIPVGIAFSTAIGITPSVLADLRFQAAAFIGGHRLVLLAKLSKSWLCGPWF